MDKVEAIVIGAGVVGLACARELAIAGHEVLVIEKERAFGMGISSRNSEVIHAGIYYPQNSLKAKACVEGRKMLYEYCKAHHVNHSNCGKFIIATNDEQITKLKAIEANAIASDVHDLQWVEKSRINELEPEVNAISALFSPSTGIIDSHSYMQSLIADIENEGGMVVFNSSVEEIEIDEGFIIRTSEGFEIESDILINAASLNAQEIAHKTIGLDKKHIPPIYYAKGNYFTLGYKSPFKHLIYPIPQPGGLGVHVTLDLAGQARFGPDVQWIDEIDFSLDESRAISFYDAIRAYYPNLKDDGLVPGYTGIRPKLVSKGMPDADFMISGPKHHGINGLVNLFGIESPGLTSSLYIGKMVEQELI